ncbi:ABC transporter permease subunit [Thermoleophilia bacterium SCSIO 60948]|nr:ABC transporter permease subunit [Thermoleophilia bacterium SCSIO 60948]
MSAHPAAGGTSPGGFGTALVVARFALVESLRRRVFLVVTILTVAFLVLYGLGANFAFDEATQSGIATGDLVNAQTIAGSTIFGLAMFATLFLGAVLAVFLTIGVVRGDAETGLLQPLVVRPLGRRWMLLARWVAAALTSGVYVLVVYGIALLITVSLGDWEPSQKLVPGLLLAFAVMNLAAFSVLASVFLSATAQGIAVFMTFGAGLTGGLLGQIGEALSSSGLETVADVVTTLLPFEALYQDALYRLTADTTGIERVFVNLGPFGGAQQAGAPILLWAAVMTAGLLALAGAAFMRRDL